MVGPTLLDVVVILNLPIHGEEQSSLFGTCCIPSTTLGIKFSKDDSRYSKFMLLKAKKSGVVSSTQGEKVKHVIVKLNTMCLLDFSQWVAEQLDNKTPKSRRLKAQGE
ncbi:hypothetical protein JHK85_004660 [Glycine max]|nr:hypothetical protein JHK85_004660 [Glycine max]